jgi:hypothetical protein
LSASTLGCGGCLIAHPLIQPRHGGTVTGEHGTAAGYKEKEHAMFADTKAFGAFAAHDLAQARKFYGHTLGDPGFRAARTAHPAPAGGGDIRVYAKPDHSPATYTILMFQADDIEAAVGELTKCGVQFEGYDGMHQDERGIIRGRRPVHRCLVQGPGRKHPRGATGAGLRQSHLVLHDRSHWSAWTPGVVAQGGHTGRAGQPQDDEREVAC